MVEIFSKRSMTKTLSHVLLVALAASLMLLIVANGGKLENRGVLYDGRSLIINGRRELLFSGSIHYTRSPPEVRNFLFHSRINFLLRWPLEVAMLFLGLEVIQNFM